MPDSILPERASLEYLKKLAKDRLRELRIADPKVKLTTAQLAVARDHGFTSWRSLKTHLEQRQVTDATLYFEACSKGDIDSLRALLASAPALIRANRANTSVRGWTGLHEAAKQGHTEAVRILLSHGADPNARETGDNTYPLHWAAAHRHPEIVRALLDAGGDVHGTGDHHGLDVIGWATYFRDPGRPVGDKPEVATLLVERGARHHIFSAVSLGDLNLIRTVVAQDPATLRRKMSRFEEEQTPLHFAMSIARYDVLDLLIELGADLEASDKHGHSPLETAMLRGDQEAVRRLLAAGAKMPRRIRREARKVLVKTAPSVTKLRPMIYVPDVAAALAWYTALGFKEVARYSDDGIVSFGVVALGKGEILINNNGRRGEHDVSLWFNSDRVDEMYARLKSRQLRAALEGTSGRSSEGIEFVEHINDTFYGARQFGVRDLNGYILYFIQQLRPAAPSREETTVEIT
jgi:ankyrin repeat protein